MQLVVIFVLSTVAPLVSDISESQTYSRGDNVTLSCASLGGPGNYYQWQFEAVNVTGGDSETLTLNSVEASDGGQYTCVVSNTAGNDSDSVSVYISPYFITEPQDIGEFNGSPVSLTCMAESFPAPEYQWAREDGTDIRDQVVGTNSTTLSFGPVLFGDEGSYYCNATSLGITIQSIASTLTGIQL